MTQLTWPIQRQPDQLIKKKHKNKIEIKFMGLTNKASWLKTLLGLNLKLNCMKIIST
jgi:hypothetical protein